MGEVLQTDFERLRQLSEDIATLEEQRLLTAKAHEFSTVCALVVDKQGVIVSANAAVETLLGYQVPEVVGQPLVNLMPEERRAEHLAAFGLFVRTGNKRLPYWEGIELEARHKDGQKVPIKLTLREFSLNREDYLVGTLLNA